MPNEPRIEPVAQSHDLPGVANVAGCGRRTTISFVDLLTATTHEPPDVLLTIELG